MGKILSISKLKLACIGHEFTSDMDAINRGSLIHRCIENGGVFDNVVSYKGFKKEIPYNNDDVMGIIAIAKETIRRFVKQGGRQESIIQMDISNDYVIEGIMDYIEIDEENNHAVVMDWKTGFSGMYNNANKRSMYQAYIYPLMVFERYKFLRTITFKYVFVDEGFSEITVEHNREECDAKVNQVKEWIIKTYNSLDYVAGEHCSNCKKMDECKYVKELMKTVEDKLKTLDVGGEMITTDAEYKELNAYIKIAEKKIDTYKESKKEDADYWTFRTSNDNQLNVSDLHNGEEALKILDSLAKDGSIKLTKAQYEAVLANAPQRASTQSYKSKVFKLKK